MEEFAIFHQEAAYIKIHAEIPDILSEFAKPCNTKIYPTWEHFLNAFLSLGKDLSVNIFKQDALIYVD